jgi:hypothetical protein
MRDHSPQQLTLRDFVNEFQSRVRRDEDATREVVECEHARMQAGSAAGANNIAPNGCGGAAVGGEPERTFGAGGRFFFENGPVSPNELVRFARASRSK